MNKLFVIAILMSLFIFSSCSSFKAERVSSDESDEKAMGITDEWVAKDTELVVEDILGQIRKHRGFQSYKSELGRKPKIFIAEVQNQTSEAYFPIEDLNDDFLNELSQSSEYILVDAQARDSILREIQYQNDGMVDPLQAKKIGKQTGADLMIFGAVRMKPVSRGGKTLKEYSVNLRMTDIEKGIEVLRTRVRINKFSKKSSIGW